MPVDTRSIYMPAIDKAVVKTMQRFNDELLKKFSDVCTVADVYRAGQNSFGINLTIKNSLRENTRRFIELDILQKQPIVVIHAIVTPSELAHHGLGKQLIRELFQASIANSHELVISGLVPSFMRSLLKRGAHKLDGDNVQITASTNLLDRASA